MTLSHGVANIVLYLVVPFTEIASFGAVRCIVAANTSPQRRQQKTKATPKSDPPRLVTWYLAIQSQVRISTTFTATVPQRRTPGQNADIGEPGPTSLLVPDLPAR